MSCVEKLVEMGHPRCKETLSRKIGLRHKPDKLLAVGIHFAQ